MSINGSIQQLGSGIAALCAGAIVTTEKSGRILNYNWVGYLSIFVLVLSLFFGRAIFRNIDNTSTNKGETTREDLVQEIV